jgi:two-component system cell cycle sensor histidine kinase PleC
MARTWSVPQRGSFADFGISELRQNGSLLEHGSGRGFARRGPFLFFAALLTAAGAIVPHLDSDMLSTLLFVAGAGLAALVVMLPSQPQPVNENGQGRPRDLLPTPNVSNNGQTRFAELLGNASSNAALDRAAWAKLTAHMSHELRTPLNAVLGFSELMTNEVFGPLGAGYSAYARDIHASGRILLKSAEDALAITALLTAPERKRARESSRLKSVLDEACVFAATDFAARSIAVAIDIDASIDIAHDHQVTRQMLINLIAEAVRSAKAGAILRIETKSVPEAVELSFSLAADGNDAPTDDGFGMILARTLCELSGARLGSSTTALGERNWTVRLLRAAQDDLFLTAA